ncbi:hypothetical protein BGZ93_009294 [Podila epicladia]|nr:hypothetical protein BGZ93_009294 [Podila epicladia]
MQERLDSLTSKLVQSEETFKDQVDHLTNQVHRQSGVMEMLREELDEQDQRATTQAKKLRRLQAPRPLGSTLAGLKVSSTVAAVND